MLLGNVGLYASLEFDIGYPLRPRGVFRATPGAYQTGFYGINLSRIEGVVDAGFGDIRPRVINAFGAPIDLDAVTAGEEMKLGVVDAVIVVSLTIDGEDLVVLRADDKNGGLGSYRTSGRLPHVA